MASRIQEIDANGHPVQGEYNSSLPTYANGDVVTPQYDSSGRLIVTGSTGSSSTTVQGTAADNAAAVGNPVRVGGIYESGTDTYTDEDIADLHMDVNGNLKVREQYAPSAEDNANGVIKVEQRFSGQHVTADTQIVAGAGFIHSLTFAQTDAAPTAGSIIVYDSLTETGTIIYSETFDTTVFRGYTVILDRTFSTGLYIGFTTTADVGVSVSYRADS